ncbi:MAG: hypothetical protein P8R54_29245 [Myxococcota bacterium]|nr:hypothetical protein [Myxococcota bacterium]
MSPPQKHTGLLGSARGGLGGRSELLIVVGVTVWWDRSARMSLQTNR